MVLLTVESHSTLQTAGRPRGVGTHAGISNPEGGEVSAIAARARSAHPIARTWPPCQQNNPPYSCCSLLQRGMGLPSQPPQCFISHSYEVCLGPRNCPGSQPSEQILTIRSCFKLMVPLISSGFQDHGDRER